MKVFLWVFSFTIFTAGCSHQQKNSEACVENHAAMDFGSGATKALVAEVDVCQKKINKILFQEHLALALNESLEKSSDQKIPTAVAEAALPSLRNFLKQVRAYEPRKTLAVATSVFRVAKNGAEIADYFSKNLDINLKVISQREEAELGYYSVLSLGLVQDREQLIVWDIGGGSMQMYTFQKQQPLIFEGDLASVTYKNSVIEKVKKKDPRKQPSPNPLGKGYSAALKISEAHALKNVPAELQAKAPQAVWYGIGGVISYSVQNQTKAGASRIDQQELYNAFKERAQLKDSQIDSDYRITDVTNLGLVLGYMRSLKINEIKTVKASLGQGLLFRDLK